MRPREAVGSRDRTGKHSASRNDYTVLYQAVQRYTDVGTVFSPRQLDCIESHKYSSEGSSLLEPFFQPFWQRIVDFVPRNVAPNLLTVVGLLCNVLPSLLMFVLSNGARNQCPRVCYLLCGLGLFVYQTLDAIDGKQARRTNSSSPLGELFDHGCDAISCVLIALHTMVLFQAGREPGLMFVAFFIILMSYYCAHWQTYVTGRLRFGYIEVTESQISLIVGDLVCFLFQNDFWNHKIGTAEVQVSLRMIVLAFALLACLRSSMDNIGVISNGGAGIHGSSIANSSIVSPLFQYVLIVLMAYTISQKSNSRLYENYTILYLFTFGLVWVKYTDFLIVATMSRSRIFMIDTILTGPCLLLLNQYLGYVISEYIVLYIACVFCTIDLARYNIRVCNEICDHLNINCFSIGKRKPKKR